MNEKQKIPGEKIALIEEYLPGENTFEEDDSIRATAIGDIQLDASDRLASINRHKQITVPKVGDIIIGVVEANLPSMIAIMIKFVNGKKANSNLDCICKCYQHISSVVRCVIYSFHLLCSYYFTVTDFIYLLKIFLSGFIQFSLENNRNLERCGKCITNLF